MSLHLRRVCKHTGVQTPTHTNSVSNLDTPPPPPLLVHLPNCLQKPTTVIAITQMQVQTHTPLCPAPANTRAYCKIHVRLFGVEHVPYKPSDFGR